ncbi:hypothetical protein [Microbacterium oleivorans]|uniref:Helix-turn-helix domain-containing protein n=1 Tax=Microbacterium oleivorans TaxID=273677 RepID=A0A4R5YGB4_9MICO|nr:hypothetical protein [Microbacterium oleivorans]TDL44063.1 hypothetical protein E2R54_12925 [Microbacterium oleivorans]
MTDNRNQHVRTDAVDDALVTLDDLAVAYRVSRHTIDRWLTADTIERVPFGREKAVRLGDISNLPEHPVRWQRKKPRK